MKRRQIVVTLGLVVAMGLAVLLSLILTRGPARGPEKIEVPQVCTIEISAFDEKRNPIEANVYLDGVYLGKRSHIQQKISLGSYTLRGEIPGYRDEKTVQCEKAGETVKAELVIKKEVPVAKIDEELTSRFEELLIGQKKIVQLMEELLQKQVKPEPKPEVKPEPKPEVKPEVKAEKAYRLGLAAVAGNYITGLDARGWFGDGNFGPSLMIFAYQGDGQMMMRVGLGLLWKMGNSPFYLHGRVGYAQYGAVSGWANVQVGLGAELTLETFYLVLEGGGVISRRAIGSAFTLGVGIWLGGEKK